MYSITDLDRRRISDIKDKITSWPFDHNLSANDLMPDIIYLLERLECTEKELKNLGYFHI